MGSSADDTLTGPDDGLERLASALADAINADGTYFVVAQAEHHGLGSELWDDIQCEPHICGDPGFVRDHGTAIEITGGDRLDIHFDLSVPTGGLITGRLIDFGTGLPVMGIGMALIDADTGDFLKGVNANGSGEYYFTGLEGHVELVGWSWFGASCNVLAFLLLLIPKTRKNPVTMNIGCVLVFIGVFIEKGIGLVLPGLTPGTLGEVYLPLMKGSVGTALLLVFVDCVKELPATLLLRPFNYDTLATRAHEKARCGERAGDRR